MNENDETQAQVLEAVGAAATMTNLLAVIVSKSLDKPEILSAFKTVLLELADKPGTSAISAVVYRQSAATLSQA